MIDKLVLFKNMENTVFSLLCWSAIYPLILKSYNKRFPRYDRGTVLLVHPVLISLIINNWLFLTDIMSNDASMQVCRRNSIAAGLALPPTADYYEFDAKESLRTLKRLLASVKCSKLYPIWQWRNYLNHTGHKKQTNITQTGVRWDDASRRPAHHLGGQMGGLLRQVRFWLPAFWWKCWSDVQWYHQANYAGQWHVSSILIKS